MFNGSGFNQVDRLHLTSSSVADYQITMLIYDQTTVPCKVFGAGSI